MGELASKDCSVFSYGGHLVFRSEAILVGSHPGSLLIKQIVDNCMRRTTDID